MKKEPIAIVGIGCRFPKAIDKQEFWQLLCNGVDAIAPIPSSRWDIDRYYHPTPQTPNKINSRFGGFLDNIEYFDPHLFGISPQEAKSIDPQQRLILESAYSALEDAGENIQELAQTPTGVFVGCSTHDYYVMMWRELQEAINSPYAITATANGLTANRVSYLFNFQGPSITIDTACASSLVAVHLACQSIANGESTLALAGGVNVLLIPTGTVGFAQAGLLASDGRCKTFDAKADGYVRGEGVGMVVLKSLSRAIADGSNIYAIIQGSAVNHNGHGNGLVAPNPQSQKAVILSAYAQAGIAPGKVQYVEVQGTGTLLGDSIEMCALGEVLSPQRASDNPCIVGCVKTNIGHLEAASGIAGLIKVALSLHNRQIPPSLHYQKPNPYIDFPRLGLKVQQTLTPWVTNHEPAIAGISAFGFGGTNAHLVLTEAPSLEVSTSSIDRSWHLWTLSAKSEKALKELVHQYIKYLEGNSEVCLGDICWTANQGRSHYPYRLAIIAESTKELQQKLRAFEQGEETTGLFSHQLTTKKKQKIAFVFTDEQLEYKGIGKELYQTHPSFSQAVLDCQKLLNSKHIATGDSDIALFILKYATAKLWQAWGINPDAVIGYGVGERVAACIDGSLSLEDALKMTLQEKDRALQKPTTLEGIKRLQDKNISIFLEIGGSQEAFPVTGLWCRSRGKGVGEWESILENVAQLYVQGVKVSWKEFFRGYNTRKVSLPNYPFQRQRYWLDLPPIPQGTATTVVELLHQGNIEELIQQIAIEKNLSPSQQQLLPELLSMLVQKHQQEREGKLGEDWVYQLQWQPLPRQIKPPQPSTPTHWVILGDDHGVGKSLYHELKKDYKCTLIHVGEEFQEIEENIKVVNPSRIEDFQQLWKKIRIECQGSLVNMIHAWSLNTVFSHNLTLSQLQDAQRLGCCSLLYLVQSLSEYEQDLKVRLWILTQGAQPVGKTYKLAVEQSPIWGLGKVTAREYPQLWGGMIDLDASYKSEGIASLIEEFTDNQGEDHLAFRQGQRYVARLGKQWIAKTTTTKLLPDATYLITGGLGALGLRVAQWMVEQGVKNIVLTDICPPSTTAETKISLMQQLGVNIVVMRADVAVEKDMSELFVFIHETMPPLKGIIHAAGTLTSKSLKKIPLDMLDAVIRPKVMGGWLLHQLSKNLDIDFFVTFSSVASVWGFKGLGVYAAGNHFLDILAHYRHQQNLPALTINWSLWTDGGMSTDKSLTKSRFIGLIPLDPEQGMRIFNRIINIKMPQAIIADINWPLFSNFCEVNKLKITLESIRDNPTEEVLLRKEVEVNPPLNNIEQSISTIVQQVLQLDGINIHDNLFDLGAKSMDIVQIHKQLEDALHQSIPITDIFQNPTIDLLAKHFDKKEASETFLKNVYERGEKRQQRRQRKA